MAYRPFYPDQVPSETGIFLYERGRKMRRYETFVLAAILVGGFTPITEATPVKWPVAEGGNGHFYEAFSVSDGISWTSASQLAYQKGGYLVTITSQAENDFVHGLINDPIYWDGPSGPWIGGYQPPGSPEPAGGWRWVTDEPFLYNNWNDQQPNEYNGNNENRIHFGYMAQTPFWNDVPDTAVIVDGRRIRGYIVETLPSPDLNVDGKVDFNDFSLLAAYWGQQEPSVDIAPLPLGDNKVDYEDMACFAENWLTGTKIPPLPEQATNPNPVYGEAGVDINADLSWTPALGAASYDVYFGTSNPPPFLLNQTATTFEPGTMSQSTIYYWIIDSVNGWGKTQGRVWYFSTIVPPPF